jgi:hypothetical protein
MAEMTRFASRHSNAAFLNKKAQPFRAGLSFVVGDVQEWAAIGSRDLQQLPHRPDPRRDTSGHRRRHSKALVNAAEVVERVPKRYGGPVVLPFLREGIRKPGESSNAHTRAEVGPLDYRSADALRIGAAHNWDLLHGSDFGWTVPRLSVRRRAVDLDEHRIIASVAQRGSDGRFVGLKSIGGDLELSAGGVPQALDKYVRRSLVALAHRDVQHQFGMSLNRHEGIAVAQVLIVSGPHTFLLLADETPNLVQLHIPDFHVTDLAGHDLFALLASDYENLKDRSMMDSSEALNRADRTAFNQKLQDFFGFVHFGVHAAERLAMRFGEGALALAALIPLQAVAMFAESTAFGVTLYAWLGVGPADLPAAQG